MPFQNRSLKPDKTASQDLSAAALAYTTDYARRVKIESISIHASVGITETITITLDSVNGANYDVVLSEYNLVSEQDFVFRPRGELNLGASDKILVACTNANTTGVVYVTVKASELLK